MSREKIRIVNESGLRGSGIRPNVNNINDVNKNGKCGKIKGKVRCYRTDGTWFYITPERQEAMYYGLDGEIHSLRQKPPPWNKGKRKKDVKITA